MLKALFILFFFNTTAGTELTKNIEKINGYSSALSAEAGPSAPAESIVSAQAEIRLKTKNLNKSAVAGVKKQVQNPSLKDGISGKEHLVEKLDYLNRTLPENHKAKKALNLRLAHALSLIAEENFIKYEKEKCLKCLKTAQDSAHRSLSVYKQLDSVLLKQTLLHATALFQQAYLERFLGNKEKSLFQLKRITEKKNLPALLTARAWYNMGEIYFELYDYSQALSAFNQTLKIKSPWKFKAVYRKIWSLFNLSRYQQSIEELMAFLKSDLYANAKQDDRNFKRKLESELVTLYSYSKITNQYLSFLYNFNKQEPAKNANLERNQRLFDLAKALNRIGRLKESNQVLETYLSKTIGLDSKLSAYSLILDNDLVLNYADKLAEAGKKIEKIFILQKKTDKYRKEIGSTIQKFFSQISKQGLNSKKDKEYLLSLYQQYNSIYPLSLNVLLETAVLADSLNKYVLAGDLFRKSVVNMEQPDQKKLKESINIRQMELAELTKNNDTRLKAYNFYIDHGADPFLIFKVKYQIAYMAYSNKEFQKASDLFSKMALSEEKSKKKAIQELQIKSAHLVLSALDQMGNQEERLMNQAELFMERFPKNRQEFASIYNSAVLNTVKKLVAGKDFSHRPVQFSSDKEILKAWEVLGRFSVKDSAQNKLSSYYLDKLLLAKELLKYKQMDQSLKFLLSDKKLSSEDKRVVLTWQLWLAELRFDFKEVLRILKILSPDDPSEEQLLRLARLSELAGADPTPHYKTFINSFPNSQLNPVVLADLIEKTSSEKEKRELLRKRFRFYKKDVNKLAYLILKLDKGQLDSNFIGFFTKLSFMKNTFLDSFEKRRSLVEAFESALQKISSYSLPSQVSNSRLSFKLKSWTQAVERLRKTANALLKTEDWTAQVFIISHWKAELKRFYNSVVSLPLPKGLTVEEQKEYKALLTDQMRVYEGQIKQLESKLKVLWSQDFASDYRAGLKQDPVFYSLLKWELNKLAGIAKGEQKSQIQTLLSSLKTNQKEHQVKAKTNKIDQEAINSLYEILRKNPFDKKSLTELLSLEKNNEALSFYLSDRIEELKQKREKERL